MKLIDSAVGNEFLQFCFPEGGNDPSVFEG